MFTWLQTVMQKHYKWLFSILLVVIIIAFVFTIGNTGSGGLGAGGGKSYRVDFYGYDINPQSRDMQTLGIWTSLSLQLKKDFMGMRNSEISLRNRIVSLHLADQLNVPEPTAEQMLDYIKEIPGFKNNVSGEFSADQYTQFVDQFKNSPQINEETISTVIAQDYRIDKVLKAISGPGYVLPYQAKRDTERRETTWSMETATMSKADFTPEITVEEAALNTYYEANKNNYEVAAKTALHAIKFSQDDFVSAVTEIPNDAELQIHYSTNKYKYVKDDQIKTPQTFIEAKEEVILDLKKQKAKKLAGKKANAFTIQVYNATYEKKGMSKDSPEVQALLSSNNLILTPIPPYNADSMPIASTGLPNTALREGLSLGPDNFYTSAIETPEGAVVLFYEKTVPATIPPFEAVKEKVTADYKESQKRNLFAEKGKTIKQALSEAITNGISFEEKTEELKFEYNKYEDFSEASPPDSLDNTIMYSAFDLELNEVSEALDINDSAVILHVTKKEVPEISDDNEALKKSIERLSTQTSQSNHHSILFELTQKEMPKTDDDAESL